WDGRRRRVRASAPRARMRQLEPADDEQAGGVRAHHYALIMVRASFLLFFRALCDADCSVAGRLGCASVMLIVPPPATFVIRFGRWNVRKVRGMPLFARPRPLADFCFGRLSDDGTILGGASPIDRFLAAL